MEQLTLEAFSETYQRAVDQALTFWTPEMQREVAQHNPGWAEGSTDFERYLRRSVIRYHVAYRSIVSGRAGSLCDVGGFWGVWPVVLRRLGVERVAMTEALQYYSEAFDRLFEWVRRQGVEVFDYDPFSDARPPFEPFDRVTVMAVLEHYPSSPRRFMDNVLAMTGADGHVYLEVPNIAYWPKRVEMLVRGRTPLVPIEGIYASCDPFIGHSHEYTLAELETLCRLTGLEVVEEHAYNYSVVPVPGMPRPDRVGLVSRLAYRFSPDTREVLAVLARRKP